MQFAAIGVLGWEMTGSSTFLGYLIFAQLAPLGLLSLIGGGLADTVDRTKLITVTQLWQMAWTLVAGFLLVDGSIGELTLLAVVFLLGIGQGIYAPVFTATLPLLAGESNVAAAAALNSVQMNVARVVGPAIGGVLVTTVGFDELFFLSGISSLGIIIVLRKIDFPESASQARSLSEKVLGGWKVVASSPQVGRPIKAMAAFAFVCLPFVGQLPAIADRNLGIDADSVSYAVFYSSFGVGALVGASLVSTVLLRFDRSHLLRLCLSGFALSLWALSSVRSYELGVPVVFTVGLFYFMVPTILAIEWQSHVAAEIRGRVSAVWILAFGGVVPIANLLGGPIAEYTSLQTLLTTGAMGSMAIAAHFQFAEGPVVDERAVSAA